MLVELRIRNLAVIDDLSLTLGSGLNVLSGETGAGKSIIVGALSLLLGERASADVVRVGAARAVVEGVFDIQARDDVAAILDELGLDAEEGLLILRREVAAEGRNRAWVNGSAATAGMVGRLGALLVDLHGQHQHQALLHREAQRDILDAFCGARPLAMEVARIHGSLTELESRVEALMARHRELESRADFLRFQTEEISAAELMPEEDGALGAEVRRLENAGDLIRDAGEVHRLLGGEDRGVVDQIANVRGMLRRLADIDPSLSDSMSALDEAYHAMGETANRMSSYAESVEHDPARLEIARERLDLIFRLKQKYGPELEDVIATDERLTAELAEFEGGDLDLANYREEIERLQAELTERAAELTDLRRAGAERLQDQVQEILPALGLEGGVFEVAFDAQRAVQSFGAEAPEFLVSLNQGFAVKPLSKVASGGELSRVMLALKTVLAALDRVPTLVFDEIDAGIGGVVAAQVASNLKSVSEHHQVFVITHLPHLASKADHHLLVQKAEEEGLAATSVGALEGEARVREIARMLGGDPDSSASREHAREMLKAG